MRVLFCLWSVLPFFIIRSTRSNTAQAERFAVLEFYEAQPKKNSPLLAMYYVLSRSCTIPTICTFRVPLASCPTPRQSAITGPSIQGPQWLPPPSCWRFQSLGLVFARGYFVCRPIGVITNGEHTE